ncbi:maltodextrin glucosidase [Arthrobacter ginkgonis]|uniref:Maltodextrin glucosidase n=1 Tax=Arthrobacter ginkgonis TaxID=1630594 RepID=A0ABP7D5L4_9MICC
MIIHPHHDGSSLYVEPPNPRLRDTVKVRLRIPAGFGTVTGVWLRSVRDAEPHYDAAVRLEGSAGWDWWEAGLTMVNPVQKYRWFVEVAPEDDAARPTYLWVNARGISARDVPDAADFRIGVADPTPDWVPRSVMYQIFPDRFARSAEADGRELPDWAIPCDWNTTPVIGRGPETPYQFYGGDLRGVEEKLDHIVALGASVVYLTPMFPARSNHRYDASTFNHVDELLGGDAAFISLIEAAHARGLQVIGDLTTNHSGDAHEWFRNSHGHPEAPESGYYYFSERNTKYVAWLGVKSLPKFNWHSQALRRRFILDDDSMAVRWLKPPFNLDGWRIDVGNMTGRMGADDLNQEIAGLLRERLRQVKPEAMLLAESTSDASPDFQNGAWQGAMTYTNFTRPLWQWLVRDPEPGRRPVDFYGLPQQGPNRIEAEDLLATHLDFAAGFPWAVRRANLNAINTHDTGRAAYAMIPGGQSVGVVLQFSLPGIPLVFMGDEFGLEGWNGEDSRTPMPWDDPSRVLADLRPLYEELARVRRTHPALTEGGIRWLHAEGDVLAFVREHPSGSVLVVASRAPFNGLELPVDLVGGTPQPLAAVGGRITADRRGDPGGAGPEGAGPEGAGSDDGGTAAVVVLEGTGPSAALFALPGVHVPVEARGSAVRPEPVTAPLNPDLAGP